MEYGTADARRVSRRVLVALARVLGTTAARLERAGGFPRSAVRPSGTRADPTRSSGSATVQRGAEWLPPTRPRRPPEWDALDRLFLGEDG